jgi:hypothetical protein
MQPGRQERNRHTWLPVASCNKARKEIIPGTYAGVKKGDLKPEFFLLKIKQTFDAETN